MQQLIRSGKIIRTLFISGALVALIALNSGETLAKTKISLAGQTLTGHILPAYKKFASRADELSSRMGEYCADPDIETRRARDAAFKSLIHAWAFIEHIRFGPIMRHYIHDKIHYWPDRRGIARRQVERAIKAGNTAVLEPTRLRKKSVALQGLGALEQLLYGPLAEELAMTSERGKFICQFASAITRNISHMAQNRVVAQWLENKGFARHYKHPAPDNPHYQTQNEVNTEIAKSFLNGLHYLRDIRLAGPLGMRKGRRKKTRGAFEQSAMSMTALHANIEGLRDLFIQSGMAGWIGNLEPGLDKTVLAELDIALKQAEKIPGSLGQAIADPDLKPILISMGFPLKNARALVLETLITHTDLPLGMNALDGD